MNEHEKNIMDSQKGKAETLGFLREDHHSVWYRLERILQRAEGFELVFLQYDDTSYRDTLIDSLRKRPNSRVLDLATPRWANFAEFEAGLKKLSPNQSIFQIINLDLGTMETRDQSWLRGFNYHREALASLGCRYLFWVREIEIERFSTEAPDWWSWRSAVLDFRTNDPSDESPEDNLGFWFNPKLTLLSEERISRWFRVLLKKQGIDCKQGLEIDLSFELRGQSYLVEIRLFSQPLPHQLIPHLISLFKHIDGSAVGVVVAPNGFTKQAILAASRSRPYSPMLLVDKNHLEALAAGLHVKTWLQTYTRLAERRHKACIPIEELQREMRGESGFAYDAFLSFGGTDREIARRLNRALTKEGLRLWFDEESLNWGAGLQQAIAEGMARSRDLVLLLSPETLDSDWLAHEMAFILETFNPFNRERRLVPVLIRDCELPLELRAYKILDARDTEKMSAAIPKIVERLRS